MWCFFECIVCDVLVFRVMCYLYDACYSVQTKFTHIKMPGSKEHLKPSCETRLCYTYLRQWSRVLNASLKSRFMNAYTVGFIRLFSILEQQDESHQKALVVVIPRELWDGHVCPFFSWYDFLLENTNLWSQYILKIWQIGSRRIQKGSLI